MGGHSNRRQATIYDEHSIIVGCLLKRPVTLFPLDFQELILLVLFTLLHALAVLFVSPFPCTPLILCFVIFFSGP